jgi:sensor histidine kinase YesM
MYWVVPKFLLNGKYVQFIFIILLWGVAGVFINYLFRVYIFISAQEAMGFKQIVRGGWQAGSYLCLAVTAASTTIIKLFKYWLIKQQEWLQAEKEKVTAELQLLKAQVHPHFLFNTLNNIYSFSLEKSPKTPDLILKLSSLLSYMLYDCKEEEVLLEKEIDSMKNYIDLEKERYGNKIEISWMVVGDVRDKFIAPLLLLPFLENAFKHGTSDQVEKPWLSVDISVTGNILKCKMINSKNVSASGRNGGIGIQNVKKRLTFIYPDKHELKMNDEGNYFVVFLWIELKNQLAPEEFTSPVFIPVAENVSI